MKWDDDTPVRLSSALIWADRTAQRYERIAADQLAAGNHERYHRHAGRASAIRDFEGWLRPATDPAVITEAHQDGAPPTSVAVGYLAGSAQSLYRLRGVGPGEPASPEHRRELRAGKREGYEEAAQAITHTSIDFRPLSDPDIPEPGDGPDPWEGIEAVVALGVSAVAVAVGLVFWAARKAVRWER